MNKFDFTGFKQKLSYDSNTGIFTWKERVGNVALGAVAGTKNSNGHVQIRIDGKRVFAHKLAWAFVYKEFPDGMIDHINGIRNDNRISNLRVVTASENAHNQKKPHKRTKSGYLGVSWVSSRQKWQAGLAINGKYKFLGLFDEPEIAHEAYLAGKRIYHPSAPVN